MKRLHVLNNNLVKHNIGILRNKSTSKNDFNRSIDIVSSLLINEVLNTFTLEDKNIQTPIDTACIKCIKESIVFIPILRAGLGMLRGVENFVDDFKVGHIGVYRNEKTLDIKRYFTKIPKINSNDKIIILDPILATGATAVTTIKIINDLISNDRNIIWCSILGVENTVKKILEENDNIDIYVGELDKKLDSRGFIVPGLGDAGDRIFGTEDVYA